LCEVHLKKVQDKMEVEVLHCWDCPLGCGSEKHDETKPIRCKFDHANAMGLCSYELWEIFKPTEDLEAAKEEIQWSLISRKRLLQRWLRQNAREGMPNPQLINALESFQESQQRYAEFEGWVSSKQNMVQVNVQDRAEADMIIAEMSKAMRGEPSDARTAEPVTGDSGNRQEERSG
jgi:hypothetical protein